MSSTGGGRRARRCRPAPMIGSAESSSYAGAKWLHHPRPHHPARLSGNTPSTPFFIQKWIGQRASPKQGGGEGEAGMCVRVRASQHVNTLRQLGVYLPARSIPHPRPRDPRHLRDERPAPPATSPKSSIDVGEKTKTHPSSPRCRAVATRSTRTCRTACSG